MRGIVQRATRVGRSLLGKGVFPKLDCTCRTDRFGSQYGGWEVAVEYLDAKSLVYSFGSGQDVSFDVALIDRFGLEVHAFDPTPAAMQWLTSQRLPAELSFHEYGLADFDGEAGFNPPEDPRHVSHTILSRTATESRAITVPFKRLSTILRELGHDHLDVLKMDIEGAEFAVIHDMEQSNIRPRQVLVEFHHRFPNVGARKTRESIAQLRRMGYALFSVSPTGEEFGFIRRPA